MLPTLGAQMAQTPEFRDLAKLFRAGEEKVSTMSLFKALLSSGGNRGP
jgi:hypothetical protein